MENYEGKLLDLLDDVGRASETLKKAKYAADKIANYFGVTLVSEKEEAMILYEFATQRTASNILEDYLIKLKEIIQSTEKVVEELHQEARSRLEGQDNEKN